MKKIIFLSLLSSLLLSFSLSAQVPEGAKGKIVLQALFDGIGLKEEVPPPAPDINPSPTPEMKD